MKQHRPAPAPSPFFAITPLDTHTKPWQQRRAEICAAWRKVAGGPAHELHIRPPNYTVTEEHDMGRYLRKRIRYHVETDDWAEAWLCTPNPMPAEQLPAVLVLHGSHLTYNWGKDAAVGHRVTDDQAQAAHLAVRGYVTLAPDLPEAGRRTPRDLERYNPERFRARHPSWSLPGKGVWDNKRAVDVLSALPYVDSDRIGCTGISYGGFFALLAGAFDERIRITVPVVGWRLLMGTDADRGLFSAYYLPRLAEYLDDHRPYPFNFHEIAALTAPRALHSINEDSDPHSPPDGFEQAHRYLAEVWRSYGADVSIGYSIFEGAHNYFPEVAVETYAALDRRLCPSRVRRYSLTLAVQGVGSPCVPCKVDIDFREELDRRKQPQRLDPRSILLYRISPEGHRTAIGHRADEDVGRLERGEIAWLVDEPDQARYELEFDTVDRGPWVREIRQPLVGDGDVLRIGDDTPGPLEVAMHAAPLVADWDGDGRPDIICPSAYANTLGKPYFGTWLFRNCGSALNPVFEDFSRIMVDGRPTDVLVSAIWKRAGDETPDLLGHRYGSNTIALLENTGRRDVEGLPILSEGPAVDLPVKPTDLAVIGTDGPLLVVGTRELEDTGTYGHIRGPFYRSRYIVFPNLAEDLSGWDDPYELRFADGRPVSFDGNGTFTFCDWDGDGGRDIVSCDEHGGLHLFEEYAGYPLSTVEVRRRWEPPRYERDHMVELDTEQIRHTWGTVFGDQGGERSVGNWHVMWVDFFDQGLPGLLVPYGRYLPDRADTTAGDGGILFYENAGTRRRPRLGAPLRITTLDGNDAFAAHSCATADFTGDGTPDLVAMRPDGKLCLFRRVRTDGGLSLAPGEPLLLDDDTEMTWHYFRNCAEVPGGQFLAACPWFGAERLDLVVGTAYTMLLFRNTTDNARPRFKAEGPLTRWNTPIRHSRHNLKPCAVDWDGLDRTDLLVGAEAGWFHLFRAPCLRSPPPHVSISTTDPTETDQ